MSYQSQNLLIPVKAVTFYCEPEDELYLPAFKGSTFRGVLGRTLRQALCVLKTIRDCHACPLYKGCYYAYIFETIPDPSEPLPFNFHKYPSIPHPYVLEPPLDEKSVYRTGEFFVLRVILFGEATNYLPHFVLAVTLAGEHGVGKGNRKFSIKNYEVNTFDLSITFTTPREINSLDEGEITLSFETPLRLIYQERLVKDLKFHHLIRSFLRRVTSIYFFHCSHSLPDIPVRELLKLSESVRTKEADLHWMDWERYSNRQGRKMRLGGLVGKVTFSGPILPFISLLRAGEILHIGKNTTFGLGKYRISDA